MFEIVSQSIVTGNTTRLDMVRTLRDAKNMIRIMLGVCQSHEYDIRGISECSFVVSWGSGAGTVYFFRKVA